MKNLIDPYQHAVDLFSCGKIREAENILTGIIQKNRYDFDALNFLGIIKLNQKNYTTAISYFQQVLETIIFHPAALYNAAFAYQMLDEYDAAITYYLCLLELDPSHIDSLNNLGVIYKKKSFADKAEEYFNKVLEVDPENTNAVINLAKIKIEKNEISSALILLNDLGLIKMRKGFVEEALELWKIAQKISPELADLNYNVAHAQLLLGNFEEGWKNYEWRKKKKEYIERKFKQPELTHQEIKGKTVFVYDEQGLGDAIQFVRYLDLLKAQGATVVFQYNKKLAGIFSKVKSVDYHIPDRNIVIDDIHFDYHVSLLSLPKYFKTDLKSIPQNVPYIYSDKTVSQKLSLLFRKQSKFNIGIVWSGNPENSNDKNRSCHLSYFSKLSSLENVQLISLQKGPGLEQLEELKFTVINLEKLEINSFLHNTAVIENLDLLISVDTSVAHLAGAMGKPVWLLLPFMPDWRWMLNRKDTPWYPNTRLFRQHQPGDWGAVFNEVIKELKTEITKKIGSAAEKNDYKLERKLASG